ncbi:MAG: helix-turn-helix domain-containing protein [Defluviitaleaceae bacterium]|nr:helix-turn-helix domain-containing protein [Defluviitaleaceae bacterium]
MDRRLEKDRLDEIIGKNIRLERESRRLSRDELAEMMDLTSSHMGLIERGERGATAVTLSKLSKAFDIPIDHLFTSPKPGGLSVREEDDALPQANRKKVQSLMTCLNETELEFVVHTIKGVIAMNHTLGAKE